MKRSFFIYIIILLLIIDIVYSFNQHYHLPLDGDMSYLIMPFDGYKQVMQDPFGLSALSGKIYLGTNRFFAHWTMSSYFKTAPFVCQYITSPIDSIYLSCAIAKTLIQIFIIWLLSVYISRTWNLLKKEFLLSALLITPLFQTWGFNGYIGIIDNSITYTFFYALPLSLLMLFYLPFYIARFSNQVLSFNLTTKVLVFLLVVFITFNGPLIPATVLIICPVWVIYYWWNSYNQTVHTNTIRKLAESIKLLPRLELFYFSIITLICLYSLYIGRSNSSNFVNQISLIERYSLLPKGLYIHFTKSLGPPLLILVIVINTIIIRRHKENEDAMKLIGILKWIGILSVIYIILLPLGGYREYRPYIIRWDTIMPINLSLFYFFGISTLYLLNHYSGKLKVVYSIGIIILLSTFTFADRVDFVANACEKESLRIISESPEKIILLDCNCSVMEWGKITDYNRSKLNTQYLQYIGVLKEEKYYYQK